MRKLSDYKSRIEYIDVIKALCCIWITMFWHMDAYLESPRGIATVVGYAITDTVLALFFFFSGVLTVKEGLEEKIEPKVIGKRLCNRLIRIYPLFFLSLTTIFLASQITGGYDFSITQYIMALLGIGWLFPPQVATLWFVSQLQTYLSITAIVLLIRKPHMRMLLIVVLFCLLYLLKFFGQIDSRILLFYPAFFCGFILGKFLRKIKLQTLYGYLIVFVGMIAGGISIYLVSLNRDYSQIPISNKMIYYSVCGFGLICVALLFSKIRLLQGVFYLISYASYCMYLFHRHVFEGLVMLLDRCFDKLEALVVVVSLFLFALICQYVYSKILNLLNLDAVRV